MTLDGDCAAEPEALTWPDSPAAKGTWQVPETESAADLLRLYRDESSRSDAVAALLSADEAPKYWPPELFGDWRLDSVREVLLHALVETQPTPATSTRPASSSTASSGSCSTTDRNRALGRRPLLLVDRRRICRVITATWLP